MARILTAFFVAWLLVPFAAPALAEPVRGAGSTLAAPVVQRWAALFRDVQAAGDLSLLDNARLIQAMRLEQRRSPDALSMDQSSTDLGVDYEAVGSLGGVVRLGASSWTGENSFVLDFALSDQSLPPEELVRRRFGQFPVVIGGISVVVNVPGLAPGQLRLTGEVLGDIYLGKVQSWNDPAIAALNPGVTLPSARIVVIHREDGSGTTFNFTDFLSRHNEEWRTRVGANVLVTWPTGTGVRRSEGIGRAVQQTANAIGYLEFGQAQRLGLADVQLRNRSGAFVRVGQDTISAAALGAEWAPARDFHLSLTDAPGAEAYPITTAVFALMPRQARTPRRPATFRFFRFALTQGQQDAVALGYVPLPQPVVEQIFGYWAQTLNVSN
jgi:phosphate transport system substrate-binding protein